MIPVTVIFFSCTRIHLLKRSIKSFFEYNTYPIRKFIIVNDSGDSDIWEELRSIYHNMEFVLNPENVGLIKSIDIGYSHIETNYFFHCEDDWIVKKSGFIEASLEIMLTRPLIEEVWLCEFPNHPSETIDGVRMACENISNHTGTWHGFSTAIGLKRIEDYKKVAPYCEICGQGSIWQREGAIGQKYHELGYRTAILNGYAENIGYGQSEYLTGFEK